MPDPQGSQSGQPDQIDLSAGLVPKATPQIDLSAGLVPKSQTTPPPQAPGAHGTEGAVGPIVGFGKGLVKTVAGTGELINAGVSALRQPFNPGVPRDQLGLVSPEILKKAEDWADTKTPAEKVGAFGELMGEFASGEEVLAGLSRAAKLEQLASKSATVANALKNEPGLLNRVIRGSAKVAKSTTVGAAQGAVQGASEGGGDPTAAIAGAKEGAKEGAEGAAIGSTVAEVAEGVGAVAKPLLKKFGFATTSEEDLMRALQPGKRERQFTENWARVKDRIISEVQEGGKFKNMQDAADRFQDVRQNLWNREVKPAIDKHATEELFPSSALPVPQGSIPARNPIAESIRSRVTPSLQKISPDAAAKLEEFAKIFDSPMKVGEAEGHLEQMNAELAEKGYWKKTPSERAAAEKADPYIAGRVAATDSLREQLYSHLESAGERDIQELKKTYGALSSLENDIRGQVNVAGRQRPLSLKQVVGISAGAIHGGPTAVGMGIGVPLFDKWYNSPDELLGRAVSKEAAKGTQGPIREVIKDVKAGVKTVAKQSAPVAGESLLRFVGSDGRHYTVPADKKDDVLKADPGAKFQ
jgi:hypothetical protein